MSLVPTVASFTKEVNPRLAKRPLNISGHLANLELTSFVKEATGLHMFVVNKFDNSTNLFFLLYQICCKIYFYKLSHNKYMSCLSILRQSKLDLISSCVDSIEILVINTLRPRQNCHRFADSIFKGIFMNENVWISLEISLKFVPKIWIKNIPALVKIMAWHQPGDKPLSEPMMVVY